MEKKQKAEDMEALTDCLYEFDNLKHLIETSIDAKDKGEHITDNSDILLFLVNALEEKINYYQGKYNFKVPSSDRFFIQDYADFIRRSEGLSVKSSIEKIEKEKREG